MPADCNFKRRTSSAFRSRVATRRLPIDEPNTHNYNLRMATAQDMLGQLLNLPEDKRTELALALLDSVEALDPHEKLASDEFREEIRQRAEAALRTPETGTDWATLRSNISQASQD